jgi:hypothetical protein
MAKYQFRDGTAYNGPTVTMPDGRIMSGATLTKDSQRLVEIEDGSKRSGELHEASVEEAPVPASKVRGKGRKAGSVVSKKSAKAGPSV